MENERQEEGPKHRSSPAPFIGLKKSLDRVREFHQQQRQHAAPAHVAVTLWGYGSKSSGGSQTIATLKQFGLLTDEGGGSDRRVALSEIALRIIRDTREPSPERVANIQRAALMPKLHQELWKRYGADLPNEATVAYFLEVERGGFTAQSARALISEYRETIAFAGLTGGGTSEEEEPDIGPEMSTLTSPLPLTEVNQSPFSVPARSALEAGERAVFSHEVEPQHGLRVIVQGDVDQEIIDALEVYVTLARKRLQRKEAAS